MRLRLGNRKIAAMRDKPEKLLLGVTRDIFYIGVGSAQTEEARTSSGSSDARLLSSVVHASCFASSRYCSVETLPYS